MNKLSFPKRLGLFLGAWAIQMIYVPTSQWLTGGIAPKISLDALIPISPIWVVPYMLCHPLWFTAFFYAAWKMEEKLYRGFLAACYLTFSVGMLIYVSFPTFVEPQILPGKDSFSTLLRMVQFADGDYDALPSGHIYITTLLALFFSKWHSRLRVLWFSLLIVISLSTLFTGQHYLLDVVTGLIMGWGGFRFGLWWAKKEECVTPDSEKIVFQEIPE